MPEYRRNRVAGGIYLFTVVTHRRQAFLTDSVSRNCLHKAIRAVQSIRPFRIEAIVLLPDHLHCVWALPQGDSDYSTRWSGIKRSFTKRYLAANGSETSQSVSRATRGERGVWQRRFFEHTVRDETDLRRCIDYVHINPVRHGLVKRVVDWPWSSFHRYVHLGKYASTWGGSGVFYGDEWSSFE